MSKVFMLDREQYPLDPVHPGYARWLLSHQKAAVFRRYPFTNILLKEQRPGAPTQPLRLKIDPGSKTTGLALVNDASGEVVWAAELTHRGQAVGKQLADRRVVRRSRRLRKTRFRQPRFNNRRRRPGWLPPSLESRIVNVTTWCEPCNRAKGTRTAAEFGYPELQALAKLPLKDAAAVNATRWVLYHRLGTAGLPLEVGTGGRTKWNRARRNLPKTHWLDATCVGASTPEVLRLQGVLPLLITATWRQSRQMCLMNCYGFPRTSAKGKRAVFGFQTGDLMRAVVASGKRAGIHQGRVAIKASGAFKITTPLGAVPDISYRYCRLLQRADGYRYAKGGRDFLSLP